MTVDAIFYQKRHQREADRRIVVSPMVSPKAAELALLQDIEIYTHADDAVI